MYVSKKSQNDFYILKTTPFVQENMQLWIACQIKFFMFDQVSRE
jgi:hypothetical protein